MKCDFRQAAEWFLKSAEQECEIAQINLGYLFENGKGVPVDYPEAQKWYRLAMARGNARAKKAMTSLAAIMTQKKATRKRVAGLGMATKKEDERPKCGIVSDHSEQL